MSLWASDVLLIDGGIVHVRPSDHGDGVSVLDFFKQLSPRSRFRRFFSGGLPSDQWMLQTLTNENPVKARTLIAEEGDRVVGVATACRQDDPLVAEVAFAVSDEDQGRGIGTILLEQLAYWSTAAGMKRFIATSLADNRDMLSVFSDAGFRIERHFNAGTIELAFPCAPSRSVERAVAAREHRSEVASIGRLIAPKSVAVIGASRNADHVGNAILRNLVASGFKGSLFVVNPGVDAVEGVASYAKVGEIPGGVDVAVVAVPESALLDVIAQCGDARVHGVVVITSGLGESGADGRATEREMVVAARRGGMRLVGPNCIGITNTDDSVSMNATFALVPPASGTVAFGSQSGALGAEFLAQAPLYAIGVSSFFSLGNKADVSSNDLLQYWEDDARTDVILLYLESFGNPRKFGRLARRVAATKPIVAMKSGRTSAGTRGAGSHTGALAMPDDAVDALFRQSGVVRVDSFEEMLGTASVLAKQPRPPGRRVAIVSNGGGPGIIAADSCARTGLEVVELATPTRAALASEDGRPRSDNPVDLGAGVTAEEFASTLRTVLADSGVDGTIALYVALGIGSPREFARAIEEAAASSEKPVVGCITGISSPVLEACGEAAGSVPWFSSPEAAVVALGHAADYVAFTEHSRGEVPDLDHLDLDQVRTEIADFLDMTGGEGWMPFDRCERVLSAVGITIPSSGIARTVDEAVDVTTRLGYPVALKTGSRTLIHKSDVGGVVLGLVDEAMLRQAATVMLTELGESALPYHVQTMAAPGTEVIVGVREDALFGAVVLFGMGGRDAELIRDTQTRLAPLTTTEAHDLVRSLRTSSKLFGYRGATPTDTGALEDLILRIGALADAVPELREIDLNPVVVTEAGVVAVDAKMLAAPVAHDRTGGPRGLRSP